MNTRPQQNPGEPCGETVEINGRNRRCKFHFGVEHFTSITQMKRLVQPDPRDGRIQQDTFIPDETGYNVLRWSLDGSPSRGEYPAEDPIRFDRELRIHAPTGRTHYGWLPVWENGLTWPYWSYQHGFGGDYYNRILKAAMRHEIQDQIDDARYGMGDAMHVHHVEPNTFAVLSSAWMGRKGLFARNVELVEPHPSYKLFADRDLAFEWQEFHAENAELEVLTPEEHRAIHAAKAGAE
jgi:hypothetical protein